MMNMQQTHTGQILSWFPLLKATPEVLVPPSTRPSTRATAGLSLVELGQKVPSKIQFDLKDCAKAVIKFKFKSNSFEVVYTKSLQT